MACSIVPRPVLEGLRLLVVVDAVHGRRASPVERGLREAQEPGQQRGYQPRGIQIGATKFIPTSHVSSQAEMFKQLSGAFCAKPHVLWPFSSENERRFQPCSSVLPIQRFLILLHQLGVGGICSIRSSERPSTRASELF